MQALLHELFEDDDEDGAAADHALPPLRFCAHAPAISGLALVKAWLPPEEQRRVLDCIRREGWFDGVEVCGGGGESTGDASGNGDVSGGGDGAAPAQSPSAQTPPKTRPNNNQVMLLGGGLPPWLAALAQSIEPLAARVAPAAVAARHPLFDTAIANYYAPGEGLARHVDLLRFEDGVAVVSFGGEAVMQLEEVVGGEGEAGEEGQEQNRHQRRRAQLLLQPGDLLLLCGAARYAWAHGFDAVNEETHAPSGARVVRAHRVSLTLRRLCGGIELTTAT